MILSFRTGSLTLGEALLVQRIQNNAADWDAICSLMISRFVGAGDAEAQIKALPVEELAINLGVLVGGILFQPQADDPERKRLTNLLDGVNLEEL